MLLSWAWPARAALEAIGPLAGAQLPGLQFPAAAHPEQCFGWGTHLGRQRACFSVASARLFSLKELESRSLATSFPLGNWELAAGLRDFGYSDWRERSLVFAGSCRLAGQLRLRLGLGLHGIWIVEQRQPPLVLGDGVLEIPMSGLLLKLGVRSPLDPGPLATTRQLQALEWKLPRDWRFSLERQAQSGARQQHVLRLEWPWKEQRLSLGWLGDTGWTGAFWCQTSAGAVLVSCWWHPVLPLSPAVGFYY
ncbi:MAG: hypothetical protein KDC10_03840 [Calditrichaeota bacterium]|nr:hypothetical protein [Candidatus Cloacimonadota bacterium]MCA9786768.1 hypothetical protein [Candidatus Cloacimonadota bacterium]MCB1046311.1 hypothetical protein [Calditrichota bacterium]